MGLFTRREVFPSKRVTLTLTHFLVFLRRVYKAARVTLVGGFLRARVSLAGGLTFSLVNTPSRVNLLTRVSFLTVSFECNRAQGYPYLLSFS